MSFKEPQPVRHVPASSDSSQTLRPGDSLGAFVGYLRRPKSTSSGLIAQFFGENGEDADVITALHLTKFLNAHVKVTVWMMKDRNGRVMKKDGGYPKLTEFICSVRRPQPSSAGQVAQFFGENGANSDAINILNQSIYLDALVYVEMHQAYQGMSVSDIATDQPTEALEEHRGRMTPTEAQDFKKLQKNAQEAMRALVASGFFRQESVLACLGRPDDYEKWLSTQFCCHPGKEPCNEQPVSAWHVPGVKRYSSIPLCHKHQEDWEAGNVELPDSGAPMAFAQTQTIVYTQRWAQYALARHLNTPSDSIPTPSAVNTWVTEKKLTMFLPNSFKVFLSQ